MKKINLNLNYAEIRKRIELDKDRYGVGEWAGLIGISINSVSNIHGKKSKVNPSIEYIVSVSKLTGKPVEWYLYGKTTATESPPPAANPAKDFPPAHWPEEMRVACQQMKEIIMSNHPAIKPALLSNLAAFHGSIENERFQDEKIMDLNRRLQQLEERDQAKRCTGTDEAASSSTGKTGT